MLVLNRVPETIRQFLSFTVRLKRLVFYAPTFYGWQASSIVCCTANFVVDNERMPIQRENRVRGLTIDIRGHIHHIIVIVQRAIANGERL
jgi:hypothetical protein